MTGGRRPRRSVRAFLIWTVSASVVIAVAAEIMIGQFAVQANPLAATLSQLSTSRPAVHLEQQRQHMILMVAATRTFKVVGTPTVATVPAPAGGAPTVYAPAPSPGTAQAIAYKLLPTFGFNAAQQFGCLDNIWSRESGWRYNAANASGAYGIPQALPGSKMATAGADWATNPATQISWGLGYIKGRYGTPCNAWAFWLGHQWY